MANEQLFEALAQAKSQPSKALRAVKSAAGAGENILGGYLQGQDIRQKLDQYRLLNSPLGSLYPDPSQIPFGLGPQHTVKDLLTIAPAMENYASPEVLNQIFGAGQPATQPPAAVAPTPAVPATSPAQPIVKNPPQPQGTTDLASIQGTGSGDQNLLPPGQNLPTPRQFTGGLPTKFIQPLMQKMNQDREARQFEEGQANENARQNKTISNENARFSMGQANEESRFQRGRQADEASKVAPLIAEAGSIQDDINSLRQLANGYSPVPFLGKAGASITAASGTNLGTPTMQRGAEIQRIVPTLTSKVNYLLNKRFNGDEAAYLQAQVVPNAGDSGDIINQKLNNLQKLVSVMQSGDENAIKMVSSAIAGRPISTSLPTSQPSSSLSSGMITIRDSQGGIHRLPVHSLGKAKQRDPGLQVVNQ